MCNICGQDHPRCKSHRRAGGPCMGWPDRGYDYCKNHGGRLPSVRAASERRQAEAEMNRAVLTYGLRRDVTPQQALLEEVQWTSGHVAWLREQVQALETQALHVGAEAVKTKVTAIQDGKGNIAPAPPGAFAEVESRGGARIHVLLDLYQRERKHLVEVSAVALKLGLEERQVRLAEDQGLLVAGVIRRILGDLHLSADQAALVGEVVPRRLRELVVEGGEA